MPLGNPIRKQNESRMVSVLATEGQTVFTVQGGYIINHISVFRNGVRLSPAEDFTAGDGSTVTLNDAANVEDRIDFHIFDRFTVQNAIIGAASTQTINGDLVLNGKLFGALDVPSINLTGIVTATELDINGKGDISGDLNVAGVSTFTNVVSSGVVTATTFVGAVTGNVTGNISGSTGTFSGDVDIADKIVHTGDTNTALRFPSADTISLETGGTERARVTSAGKVGVGTASPGMFVHINSVGTNDVLKLTANGSGQMVNLQNHSNVPAIVRFSNYLGNAFWDAQYNTDNSFALDYSDSEKFRITSAGNIGINETSPSHKLVVGGDIGVGFNTPNDAARQLNFNVNRGSAGQTLANINWQWNSKYVAQIRGMAGADTTNKDDAHLVFFTSAANNLVERLRITSDGKIGIGGETSPEYKVTVYDAGYSGVTIKSNRTTSDANIGGLHFKTQSTNVAYIQSLVDGTIKFRNSSSLTERMRITSAGYVGINQSSPGTGLHVSQDWVANYGSISAEGSANALVGMGLRSNGSYKAALIWRDGSSGDYLELATQSSDPILFKTSNTEVMRLSGSRLGLGTNSPDELLHLKSTASAGACIELDNNGNYKSQLKTNSDALEVRGPQAINFYTGNNDGASSTIRLNIDNTGRLRINGANTGNKISMNVSDGSTLGSSSDGIRINSGTPNCQFVRLGTSYSYGGVSGSGGATLLYSYDALRILADTSNPITFHTGGALRMQLLGNGKFYYGTDTSNQDGNIFNIVGTKNYSGGIVQQQLSVADAAAYNTTDNGGSIAFQAKYHSNGAYTQMASCGGLKVNNTSGNYGGRFQIKVRNHNGNNIEYVDIQPSRSRFINSITTESELNLIREDGVAANKYMDIGYQSNTFYIRRTNGGDGGHAVQMSITSDGTISGILNNTSDGKRKQNITSIADGSLALVKQLRPVTFDWIDSTYQDNQTGFIAQEVKAVIPNLVNGEEYDETKVNEKGQIISTGYSINTTGIVAHLTKALQELSAKNDALEARIAALEGS